MSLLLVGLALALAPTARAAVKLPNILSDHAVLQRDAPIHIWGWAEPGESVTVTFHDQQRSAVADRLGHWEIYLPPEHAGGPYELRVAATNTIVLSDILIGDVWFASGQSNMEMPLEGFPGQAVLKNAAQEIATADRPNIRLLLIGEKTSNYPLQDQPATWTPCTPATATKFSAVAYLFGREIEQREHVPVGLIDSTWGGSPAEAWISLDAISADASLMPVFSVWSALADDQQDLPAVIESRGTRRCRRPSRRAAGGASLAPRSGFVAARRPLQRHGRTGYAFRHQGSHLVSGRDQQRRRPRQSLPARLLHPHLRLASPVAAGEFPLPVRPDLQLQADSAGILGDPPRSATAHPRPHQHGHGGQPRRGRRGEHSSLRQADRRRAISSGRSCSRLWRGRRVLRPALPPGDRRRHRPARVVRPHRRKAGFAAAHSGRIRSRGRRSPFRRRHCPHRGRHGFRQQSARSRSPAMSATPGPTFPRPRSSTPRACPHRPSPPSSEWAQLYTLRKNARPVRL